MEYEDILFTCLDNKKNLYFCHLIEFRYKREWYICKVSKETLKELLDNKIPIQEVYKRAEIILNLTSQGEFRKEKLRESILVEYLETFPKEIKLNVFDS